MLSLLQNLNFFEVWVANIDVNWLRLGVLLPVMVNFEIILAIVVSKEVVLSSVLSPFNTRKATTATKHQEHQNQERDEQCEVLGHLKESLIHVFCLLARCIGILSVYPLLIFVKVHRIDLRELKRPLRKAFFILVDKIGHFLCVISVVFK